MHPRCTQYRRQGMKWATSEKYRLPHIETAATRSASPIACWLPTMWASAPRAPVMKHASANTTPISAATARMARKRVTSCVVMTRLSLRAVQRVPCSGEDAVVRLRQLFPDARDDVDPVGAYASPPAVRLNMIASVDGASSVGGVSGSLGGPADKVVFAAIRSHADAIVVGAGTMRTEGYGPFAGGPIAVVTRSCRLDWSSRFFTDATNRPIVVTVSSAAAGDRARAADVADVVLAGERDVDLADAIGQLH